MLPAMATMSDHGASLIAFESAGSVARSQEILDGWGDAGRAAMWWQLALDIPFLVGYGLFLAGACAAVAGRARALDKGQLERIAVVFAWFGPIAAAADLLQNISLAFVLAVHPAQPWARISALAGRFTTVLMGLAALLALYGLIATRSGAAARRGSGRSGPEPAALLGQHHRGRGQQPRRRCARCAGEPEAAGSSFASWRYSRETRLVRKTVAISPSRSAAEATSLRASSSPSKAILSSAG